MCNLFEENFVENYLGELTCSLLHNVYYCYAYKLEENKHVAYEIKAKDVANVLAGAHEKVHGLLVLGIVYDYSSVHFTR